MAGFNGGNVNFRNVESGNGETFGGNGGHSLVSAGTAGGFTCSDIHPFGNGNAFYGAGNGGGDGGGGSIEDERSGGEAGFGGFDTIIGVVIGNLGAGAGFFHGESFVSVVSFDLIVNYGEGGLG